MTKRERVDAALAGGPVDRIPISLWRHLPDIDLDPTALAEARAQVSQALVGGLDECGSMITNSPEAARAQVRDVLSQCRGRRLIVGPGCVVYLRVPEANLAAARAAVEDLGAP
jgi:uroporphyrinogen-III decarboxylase